MSTAWIITIIVVVVLGAAIVALFFMGRKAQKQQDEQAQQMQKTAQTMNCYIIDKKKMRMTNAGLPKIVTDSAGWRAKFVRVPIVKVKVGPKVMSMVCDPDVFKILAPHQEVKASVSGMYICSAKRIRGPIVEPKKIKKKTENFLDKLR